MYAILSATIRYAFKFVAELSPHIDVEIFAMVKWIVLVEWYNPLIVAFLK